MICPTCANANLVHDIRDIVHEYKGESTVLPAVTADFCPACDGYLMDLKESRRTMELILAFHRQVNASIIDPA